MSRRRGGPKARCTCGRCTHRIVFRPAGSAGSPPPSAAQAMRAAFAGRAPTGALVIESAPDQPCAIPGRRQQRR